MKVSVIIEGKEYAAEVDASKPVDHLMDTFQKELGRLDLVRLAFLSPGNAAPVEVDYMEERIDELLDLLEPGEKMVLLPDGTGAKFDIGGKIVEKKIGKSSTVNQILDLINESEKPLVANGIIHNGKEMSGSIVLYPLVRPDTVFQVLTDSPTPAQKTPTPQKRAAPPQETPTPQKPAPEPAKEEVAEEHSVKFNINGTIVEENIFGFHTVSSILSWLGKKYDRTDFKGLQLFGATLDLNDDFDGIKVYGRTDPLVVVTETDAPLIVSSSSPKATQSGLTREDGKPLFGDFTVFMQLPKERAENGTPAEFDVMGQIIELLVPPTATVSHVVQLLRRKSGQDSIEGLMFDGAFLDDTDDFFDFLCYFQAQRKPFVACMPNYHSPTIPISFSVHGKWYREKVPVKAMPDEFVEIAEKVSGVQKLSLYMNYEPADMSRPMLRLLSEGGNIMLCADESYLSEDLVCKPSPFPVGVSSSSTTDTKKPVKQEKSEKRPSPCVGLDVQIARFVVNKTEIKHPLAGLNTAGGALESLRKYYAIDEGIELRYKGATIDPDDEFAEFIALSQKDPIEVVATDSSKPLNPVAAYEIQPEALNAFRVLTPKFRLDPSLLTDSTLRRNGVFPRKECHFRWKKDVAKPTEFSMAISEMDSVASVIEKLRAAKNCDDICSLYFDDAKLSIDDEFEDFIHFSSATNPIIVRSGKPQRFYVAKKEYSVTLTDDATFGELISMARTKLDKPGIATAWVDGSLANPVDVITKVAGPGSIIDLRAKVL